MAGLRKLPIVSVLLVVATIAVPLLLGRDAGPSDARFEAAQEEAREFFVRRPGLRVDSVGEKVLGADWIEEARLAEVASQSSGTIALPGRMLARSQTKLDALIDVAYEARLSSKLAWRYGVLDQSTPTENYIKHAFVPEASAGMMLSVAVLLIVGVMLERSWGSLVFGTFSLLSIFMSAQAFRVLDSSTGIPWSGGAGLAGALVGAYFIRGLGGHFLIPGWAILPAWFAAESFVVRGLWIENFETMPWASLFAAVGMGALISGGFRILGMEARLESMREKNSPQEPNPIISRAARLRSDGDPYQAFDLIQTAWREDPKDQDVAEAFFEIAVDVGQPEAAAEAIVPSLRKALRSGQVETALEYWLPIVSAGAVVSLEATAAVRLGEALLDAGHPQQALRSLRGAIDEGVSSSHAVRIVNIARDLDLDLACEAATIALTDGSLDDARRGDLQALLDSAAAHTVSPEADPSADRTPAPGTDGQLARRVAAEHQSVDVTSFPVADESPTDISDSSIASHAAAAQGAATQILTDGAPDEAQAAETQLIAQNLDPGALSPEGLSEEVGTASGEPEPESSGDVLSHWGERQDFGEIDPNMSLGPDLSDVPDLTEGEPLLGEEDSELFDTDFSLAADEDTDQLDPLDAETDTDLTPLMDAGDLTEALGGSAPADELTMLAGAPAEGQDFDPGIPASDQQTMIANLPPVREEPVDLAQTIVRDDPSPIESATAADFAIGVTHEPANLRELKAIDAVPCDATEERIEIDVAGRGKSKLPLDRIEAIVVAAIDGLAARPVLVVDFALNWTSDVVEPLKVIRFRSDRFDPRQFEPGESDPLDALTSWVRRLQALSEANCLPSRAILEGRFMRFTSVEAYEAEVLTAMREA